MSGERSSVFFLMIRGLLLALGLFFLLFLLVAVLYSFLDGFRATSALPVLMFLYYCAAFLGGFFVGRGSRDRGWLWGTVVGLVFSSVLLLWSSFYSSNIWTLDSAVRFFLTIITSSAGGMLGVNLKT